MPTDPISLDYEALLAKLHTSEGVDLEFKSAQGGLPNSIWPSISAFANTNGGWIILGAVERKDGTVVLDGLKDPDSIIQTFYDVLRNPNKINTPVCRSTDVWIETVIGVQIIVIRITAAQRKQRPIYINNNPYTGTYIRLHSGDHVCKKPEVDRMMRDASDEGSDSRILERFGLDDLDPDGLRRYRRMYQTQHPDLPRTDYEDKEFLQAVGGYGRDRDRSIEGLTIAGLLVLGKPEAIHEWRSRHIIEYQLLPSNPSDETRWEDRVVWEGNLLTAFETIYPRLIAHLTIPFRIERGIRVGESKIHEVLREAFVNLLAHTDYSDSRNSLIIQNPQSYIFRNPGNSRVPESAFIIGSGSDPRNPAIIRMFRLIGLAEESGTGIPKILNYWRDLGFQFPQITPHSEDYEFRIELRAAHLLSRRDREWLQSLGGNWSEAEQIALVLVRHEGTVDNLRLRTLVGLHPSDATRVLTRLRDDGYLTVIGSRRKAKYSLGPATREPVQALTGQPMTSDTWDLLKEIAARSGVLSPLPRSIFEKLILELCAVAPLSRSEMALLVQRNVKYIGEITRRLQATGYLSYLYPGQPSRTDQRYSTVKQLPDPSIEQSTFELS